MLHVYTLNLVQWIIDIPQVTPGKNMNKIDSHLLCSTLCKKDIIIKIDVGPQTRQLV